SRRATTRSRHAPAHRAFDARPRRPRRVKPAAARAARPRAALSSPLPAAEFQAARARHAAQPDAAASAARQPQRAPVFPPAALLPCALAHPAAARQIPNPKTQIPNPKESGGRPLLGFGAWDLELGIFI